ncbi:MAG: transcriptional regulator [Puniceicoccaceae bacterium]
MSNENNPELPFEKLERCIHEPARLAILSLLINSENGLSYGEIREKLELTYGNLERHMKVLHENSLIEVEKLQTSGRPQSHARFSEEGRESFLKYLDNLEKILMAAQGKSVEKKKDPDSFGNYASEISFS